MAYHHLHRFTCAQQFHYRRFHAHQRGPLPAGYQGSIGTTDPVDASIAIAAQTRLCVGPHRLVAGGRRRGGHHQQQQRHDDERGGIASGEVGEAFSFDGVDQFVRRPQSASLNSPEAGKFTIRILDEGRSSDPTNTFKAL